MISMARTLGAPDSVPAGKVGAQRVGWPACPRRARPTTRALDVHDVAVEAHVHAAPSRRTVPGRAHAADVVAAQVDQHHVLGPLLGIGQQLLRQALVLGRVVAARARAGDRAQSPRARRSTFTSISGDAPTSATSPKSRKNMYGDGLTVRKPAVDGERVERHRGRRSAATAPPGRRRRRRRTPARARRRPRNDPACVMLLVDRPDPGPRSIAMPRRGRDRAGQARLERGDGGHGPR